MKIEQPVEVIIWDWNGTLLDDVDICLTAMNRLLDARKLPLLGHGQYKNIFTFPVEDYYRTLGFDFKREPFEKPAMEFMDGYFSLLPTAHLTDGALELLEYFKHDRKMQVILSAMHQNSLEESVTKLGIANYFSSITGGGDHYARGKVEQAKTLIQQLKTHPGKALLIGDTLHDKQVADEIGCQCLLVAQGHQSFKRLSTNSNMVVANFKEAIRLFTRA
jgi:phosphoglycolate phosphatase